jgi:hypothetical protein
MADFKTRIDDLTGFASTDDVAIVDWLTAGAREIIDVLPMSKLERMSEVEEFTGNTPVEDKKILDVLRKDENNSNILMPCREINASQSGRAADSSYMEFATSSDPVYYLENKRLYTLPASAATDDSKLVKINEDFTILATDTSIQNFPKEATNAVVLYASRNALMRLMNAKHGNADITTALTAINTEMDETQAIADLINTQVDSAVTEIAEMVANVDDNVDTALAAMKTSADKINSAVELANLEFDKAETEADSAEAEADDSSVATALGLINTQVDAAVNLLTADPGVTDRLAAAEAAIDLAAAEIVLAKAEAAEIATQTDNAGDFETALDAINTELDKVDDIIVLASTEFDKVDNVIVEGSTQFDKTSQFLTDEDTELVSSAVQAGNAFIQESQAIVGNGNAFIQEAQAVISQAQGYAAEVSARTNFTGAKGQAVKSYISTAQSRLSEAQAEIALAGGYNTAINAYLSAAQGYAAEIQAYVTTSQMFIRTASNRVNVGNAYLSEANARAAEVNTYGKEVESRLGQVNAQGVVAASYIRAAQGYATEIQSKINIVQGYGTEVNLRLTVDSKEYDWYTRQYQMVNSQFQEALQLIGIDKLKIEQMTEGR